MEFVVWSPMAVVTVTTCNTPLLPVMRENDRRILLWYPFPPPTKDHPSLQARLAVGAPPVAGVRLHWPCTDDSRIVTTSSMPHAAMPRRWVPWANGVSISPSSEILKPSLRETTAPNPRCCLVSLDIELGFAFFLQAAHSSGGQDGN